jgi:ATP-dependent DNA helicase RecG
MKYDAEERKVDKISWDDYSHSPMQIIDAVWRAIPDFRESFEIPDGLFRQQVPAYDERIVRELLVNALVHRPYTQRGDIYVKLYPDRLEIVNPGRLPLGVTPRNILHQSVRRNDAMARVFHDLKLMEREGSGYDLLYEVLLSQGRPLPELREGPDSVHVVIKKRIVSPEVIDLLARADRKYTLAQREKIALGLLAQNEALTARQMARILELKGAPEVASWVGRLQKLGIVGRTGRTKGTRYYVEPRVLRNLEFPAQTSLSRIEPHRLDALVLEDLSRYPGSGIAAIHQRIGDEIKRRQVKAALDRLRERGQVRAEGSKRWQRYHRA